MTSPTKAVRSGRARLCPSVCIPSRINSSATPREHARRPPHWFTLLFSFQVPPTISPSNSALPLRSFLVTEFRITVVQGSCHFMLPRSVLLFFIRCLHLCVANFGKVCGNTLYTARIDHAATSSPFPFTLCTMSHITARTPNADGISDSVCSHTW